MNCIIHGVTKSQTRLTDFHYTTKDRSYRQLSICKVETSLKHHWECDQINIALCGNFKVLYWMTMQVVIRVPFKEAGLSKIRGF